MTNNIDVVSSYRNYEGKRSIIIIIIIIEGYIAQKLYIV
jgi:hypothetical protein